MSLIARPRGGGAARSALGLVTALLLAACAPQSTLHAQPSSSPGSGSLDTALAAFYGNHYDEAETAFAAFLRGHPGSVEGHARYALFLTYQHRFTQAAAEADTANRLSPRSGLALAVATRVRDWSAGGRPDLSAADALGARAVTAGPKVALAHIFYSEALADVGKVVEAQHQLDIATPLAGDAYERSEIDREKANLARDQGDAAGELTHLVAARTAMPGWAERIRELAEYYFIHDQLDNAVTAFRDAISLQPADATLRLSLGDVAMVRQDIPLADEAYSAALKLRPHSTEIEDRAAVTGYDLHRDSAAAEALLRQAHSDSPGDEKAAHLLEGFLRYIKKDPAAADQVSILPLADDVERRQGRQPDLQQLISDRRTAALAAVNVARAQAHLAPVRLDDRVNQSATAHAFWWLFNLALPEVKGLGIHKEVPATPGFTGITMRDRATTVGFRQASMAEDITHHGDPVGAIADWVDSVYHRFPIMRADLDVIGYGDASVGPLPMEVMDMGYTDRVGDTHIATAYPADGQVKVPIAFGGNELPDPVPTGGTYPTGYPVTVNFNPFVSVSISSQAITDPSGAAVASYLILPGPNTENVLTLLPKKPLLPGTVYHVHVAGSIHFGGAVFQFTRDWSFTTEGVPLGPAGTPA